MKFDDTLPEDAFIPIKNRDGGWCGNTVSGNVYHFFIEKQNTTMNPMFKTACGKILSFWGFTVSKKCKKCFPNEK